MPKKVKLVAVVDGEEFQFCNGLMWSNSQGEGSWYEAMKFAANCQDGGFDDWRLPTIEELAVVFDYENGELRIGGWEGYNYWSATTSSNTTPYACYTYLLNGATHSDLKTSTGNSYRCVR